LESASRRLRIEALEYLPRLMTQLREKAEAAVAKIQRAKKLVAGMSQVGALSSRSSMLVL